MKKHSIKLEWTVEDVLALTPYWSREQAETFLKVNEQRIKTIISSAGSDLLDDLLTIENENLRKNEDWDW